MITALAELGKTQRIQIIPDFDADGNVTVTVLFAPKKDDGQTIKPIQFSGPIAEVEAHIGGGFEADVNRVSGFVSNIADVEAALEKEKKEAEAKKKKPDEKKSDEKKADTKPAAKPAGSKKPAKEVKPGYKGKGETPPAEPQAPATETPAVPSSPETEANLVEGAVASAASELTEELGDLFGEGAAPAATTTEEQ